MMGKRNHANIYLMILAGILLVFARNIVFAEDTAPNRVERQREEFNLKKRLRTVSINVLKDEYVGMSVSILYVLQHDPIVSSKANIKSYKLPGFGTQVSIADEENAINGYIDRFVRYRTVTLMVKNRLLSSVAESLVKLLKEKGGLSLGAKDVLKIEVLAEEQATQEGTGEDEESRRSKAKKKKVKNLIERIDQARKDKMDRLAKLFPNLPHPLEPVDPQQEAESSQHLISSRNAFYNNDLNLALNEVIEAIKINPYSPKSYEMLGSIYYRLKWYPLAIANWEKALALDPDNKKLNDYIAKVKKEL